MLVLSACSFDQSSHGQAVLDNYQSRLSNVFEEIERKPNVLSNSLPPTLRLPSHALAEDAAPSEASSIDILDFMRLYGCRLQETLGESNSSLGRVAPTSQKLLFTVRFLRDAPSCITRLNAEGKSELAAQIQQAYEAKKKAMPRQFASAVFEGEEFAQFWSMPKQDEALTNYPEQTNLEPILALRTLADLYQHWSEGSYINADQTLESVLFQVRMGDGGDLLVSYIELNRSLTQLNDYLAQVLQSELICQPARYSPSILSNVVQKFFIGEVQVWAAALNRRMYDIQTLSSALETVFEPYLNRDYQQWAVERTSLFEQSHNLVRRHVELLSVLREEERLKAHCAN